jgi:transposase
MNFLAEFCKKLGISEIMDKNLGQTNGRKPDISYGTIANMMLVNMCDERSPLYLIQEYYRELDKDLEGIFKEKIDIEKLNDDRFAYFLDKLYEAGPRKIFSEISVSALSIYGVTINKVNYDTTSKVMWGEYETEHGKLGTVEITFGHSKEKRKDKKQIKIGIGTANGVIADAIVLSGNTDDKIFNNDNLDKVDVFLERTGTDKNNFYYIADSSFFTKANIEKAESKGIKYITRIPNTTKLCKDLKEKALKDRDSMEIVTFKNAQNKESNYLVGEYEAEYKGVYCKVAVCHSKKLKETKTKTINRRVLKENEELSKLCKKYSKRSFACESDAVKELETVINRHKAKVKYHNLDWEIDIQSKNQVGRPSKTKKANIKEYRLKLYIQKNEEKIKSIIEKECTFILASNDELMTASNILMEYKTQSTVENKFKQLKSPHFVNSLFLKTPERIEALTYMILMGIMLLSVMEYVVRRGLREDNREIIGPGRIKMKRPTLRSILRIMKDISYNHIVTRDGKVYRKLTKPLKENQKCIVDYLGLDEKIFIGDTEKIL